MVSATDSLLKYLNYCLHEELLSLEELTSVGQALSEGDVMSDASLLLEETYQLSDYFIQSSERLTSADRLTDLLGKVSYTFAEKVAQSKTPISTDERMQKAIRYIQQNVNQHLTVGNVADYVGFSKSYFSAYFKKTLGFSVSAFILRCKLEEGRELLQYTDKSISTISEFLCFSSQSHFHTAFKKQFGITPSEYRKQQND